MTIRNLNETNETYKINYPMLLGVSLVFALLLFQFHSIQFWMGVIFLLSDNNFPKSLKDNTKSTLLSIKIFR